MESAEQMMNFDHEHILKFGKDPEIFYQPPENDDKITKKIEPWLSALFQSEYLSLLVGNGLTIAVAKQANASPPTMDIGSFGNLWDNKISKLANLVAKKAERGEPNFEDQLSAALILHSANQAESTIETIELKKAISESLESLVNSVVTCESGIEKKF